MFRSVVVSIATRFVLIAAGVASSVATARLLGPDGRGTFFYWSTVAAVIMQFGNLGLHSSNTFYLARDRTLWGGLASNALVFSTVAGVLALGGLVVFANQWSPQTGGLEFAIPTAVITGTGLYYLLGSNLLVADSRFNEFNLFEVANRYGSLALIVTASWLWAKPEAALCATALAYALVSIPLFLRIRVLGAKRIAPSVSLIRQGFAYSMRAYLVSLLGFLVLRINTLIVERWAKPDELGVWSIAVQLIDIVNIIPSVIGLLLFPTILKSPRPYHVMMRTQIWVVVILVGVVFGAIFTGGFFIDLLFGPEYLASYPLLLAGLPGAVSLGLITISSQFLAAAGIPHRLLGVWAAGLVVELGAAFLFIPSHGPLGGMWAFSMAHVVVLVLIWWLVQATRADRAEPATNQGLHS